MYIWGFPGGSAVKKKKQPICQGRRCGFNPWVRKIPWRNKMATHCSILAWKISWTKGRGLQSMGLPRVGYDWATKRTTIKNKTKQKKNNNMYISIFLMKVKVAQTCLTLCDPWNSTWNSPGQNTGVGSLSLLQGIFSTQGLNPGLPHCRQILYQLSHKDIIKVLNRFTHHYLEIPLPGCYLTRNICWMPTRFSGHLRFIKKEWHLSVCFLSLHASRLPQTINSEHND